MAEDRDDDPARLEAALLALADGRGGVLSLRSQAASVRAILEGLVGEHAERGGMEVLRADSGGDPAPVAGGSLLGEVRRASARPLEIVPGWGFAQAGRRWLIDELSDGLAAVAERSPVVLLTDRAHSLDAIARAAVDHLLSARPAPPILWVDIGGALVVRPGEASAPPSEPGSGGQASPLELVCAVMPVAPIIEDLAAMFDLPAEEIATECAELVARGRLVRFLDRFLPVDESRRAEVLDSASEAMRSGLLLASLHRLLDRGVAAGALADAAMALGAASDSRLRSILVDAMSGARSRHPDDAADYGLQAVSLMSAGDDELLTAVTWELLPILWETSRAEAAASLAARVFTEYGRSDVEAQVKLWLARLTPDTERALQLCSEALALPSVDPAVRSQLLAVRIRCLSTLGRAEDVEAELPSALAEAEAQNDHGSLSRLQASLSIGLYYSGQYGGSRRWAESSTDHFLKSGLELAQWMPELMWHPYLIQILGKPVEILLRTDLMTAEIVAKNQFSAMRFVESLRASTLFTLGRLGEASDAATAAEVVTEERWGSSPGVSDRLRSMPLGVRLHVALLQGDLHTLRAIDEVLRAEPFGLTPESSRRSATWRLLVADAMGAVLSDEDALLTALRGAPEGGPMPVPWIDPADDIVFVELCLRKTWTDLADRCVRYAQKRAATNPGEPLAEAIAHHLEGIASSSRSALRAAVSSWEQLQRPLLGAAASEALGWLLSDDEPDRARELLLAAYETYSRLAAGHAAARLRKRMRDAGWQVYVGARGGDPERDDPLTPMERTVVEQAVLGSTMAQIAERLFVSRHTAVAHLRHVYTKLGINSRQELAGWFAVDSDPSGVSRT